MVRISADAAKFYAAVNGAGKSLSGFGAHARAEAARIKSFMGTIQGQLGLAGAGYGLTKMVMDSARLQKETQLLKVATGGSTEQMRQWNAELMRNQQVTGTSVQQQVELSQALQAAGLRMDAITPTLEPAARTMAVAKANADQLGRAMGVASEQFDIDLTNPRAVTELLDQMVVAGRAGNAELENLPDVFARVGGRAKEAKLGLIDTLAIVETLSKSEPQAERLSTLVDSTMRVFTNAKYMKDAKAASGVAFFNSDGSRRDPLQVLQDMHARYQQLHTDAEKMGFINQAFGKADLDTQRGMKKLLDGDSLNQIQNIKNDLTNASGIVKKDMNEAISNSVDQVSRLKGALTDAVNKGFANPLNDAISGGIKYLLDPVASSGGVGSGQDARDRQAQASQPRFSGGEILAGIAGSAALLYGASRLGGGLVSKLAGGTLDIGKGVATGKALEHAAGVTPVYVVNMGEGGMGGKGGIADLAGTAGEIAGMGKWAKMGRFVKGAGWAGAAIGAGADIYTLNSSRSSDADKASAKGSLIGAGTGMAIGGIIGSIVPVVGTAMGAMAGSWLGGMVGSWVGGKNHEASLQQQSAAGASSEFAAKYLQAGAQVAQQNATAVTAASTAGVAQQQAIGNALVSQINSTQIKGNIAVTVSPSSSLLNVTANATPATPNTTMTANVGRTGGGPS